MSNDQNSGICLDEEVRAAKEQTMGKLKWGLVLSSISRFFSMFGGPLLGAGLLGLIGLGDNGTAHTVALTAALGGAAMQLTSFAIDYVASRTNQESYFDQSEAIAQSNARHLVQELKKNNLTLQEEHHHEGNCRKDNKTWAQVVSNTQPEVQRLM